MPEKIKNAYKIKENFIILVTENNKLIVLNIQILMNEIVCTFDDIQINHLNLPNSNIK